MNILLTGKNGQVGFELQRALQPLGHVSAHDRTTCDLADPQSIRSIIQRVQPDVIVNAGAYTAVDRAESEPAQAHAVNANALEILGAQAARTGALVVHYSTDYVFDGCKSGPYAETDRPNPRNVYGASKLAGEQALQASGARHFIFRTSWVVGAYGHNFVRTMLRLARERSRLNVINDQWGAPTSAALLADVTAHAVRAATQQAVAAVPSGLYHLTASDSTNWYDYARHVINRARRAGGPVNIAEGHIYPVTTADYPAAAERPLNSRLNTDKICRAFDIRLPPWHSGVDHILDQLLQ